MEHHFNRLKNGMEVLQFDIPDTFNLDFFYSQIIKLTGDKNTARVRFTAYRTDGGLYLPSSNQWQFLIAAKPLQQKSYILPSEGLHIGVFDAIPLNYSILSPLKTTNSLPYILAAKHKHRLEVDDVVMLNQFGRIAEGSSSTIVIWDGEKLITPSLKEGGIAGIIRGLLLERTKNTGLICKEGKVTLDSLMAAKAVFLTNSIQGVKWVRKFGKKTYDKRVAKRIGGLLLEALLQTVNR